MAIVGGGWAGLAAAVRATELGHQVTLFEASRTWGGRARRLDAPATRTEGGDTGLDNGQHILIGAYSATLGLMQALGVDTGAVLLKMPLALRFADGAGLAVPGWAARLPPPLDLLAAMATARHWGWRDRVSLLRASLRWRADGFVCPPEWTVDTLCAGLTRRVVEELIEPLCVSALNTPLQRASAATFLRVMQDALFGQGFGDWRGGDLLLPRVDLGALLPEPAAAWLQRRGMDLRLGQRVVSIAREGAAWRVAGAAFDHVVLACPSWEAVRLVRTSLASGRDPAHGVAEWLRQAEGLSHEAIATVYARLPSGAPAWPGPLAMVALRSGPAAPVQFAFDRSRLGGPPGLLALVASASTADKDTLQSQALAQAQAQLGLGPLQPLVTVVEKRATFACEPGLQRPGRSIADGLWAAGDYVEGPYPATLEGAVRHGLEVAQALHGAAAD